MLRGPLSFRYAPTHTEDLCVLGALVESYVDIAQRLDTPVNYFCSMLMPAIYQRRLRVLSIDENVCGHIIWCWLDQDAFTTLYNKGAPYLHPSDWTSGDRAHIIDVVIRAGTPVTYLLPIFRRFRATQKSTNFRRRQRREGTIRSVEGRALTPKRLGFESMLDGMCKNDHGNMGQLANLIVRSKTKRLWLLGDVVRCTRVALDEIHETHWLYDDNGEALSFTLMRRHTYNLLEVVDHVSVPGLLVRVARELRRAYIGEQIGYTRRDRGAAMRIIHLAAE